MSGTSDTGQNLPGKDESKSAESNDLVSKEANEGKDSAASAGIKHESTNDTDKIEDSVKAGEGKSNTTADELKTDGEGKNASRADKALNGESELDDGKKRELETAEEKPEKEEEFLDILGNGTLLKKVLEAGSGNRPNMGDEVILHVAKEIPELEKVFPEEQLQYVLGDGDVVQALDLAVSLMNIGEKALVIAGYKYMYGDLGLEPEIPPKSNFRLTVKLLASNGQLDLSTMDFITRFTHAKEKKERGNFLYKRKEYALALNSYTKASKIVDPALGCVFNDESAENLQQLLEFRAIVLCNTSAAQFRLEAFDSAANSAVEAIRLSPAYPKAYVRLGQAQEKLGNTEQTIRNYKLALKNDSDNSKWVHGELERLTKLNKKNKKTQQEMYSKMFWGANPPSVHEKADRPKDASLLSSFDQQSGGRDVDWRKAKASLLFQLGMVLGEKVKAGEMSEDELFSVAQEYAMKFDNGGLELNSAQLMALSEEMAPLIPAEFVMTMKDRIRFLDAQDALRKSISEEPSAEKAHTAVDDTGKGIRHDDCGNLAKPASIERFKPFGRFVIEPVRCPHVSSSKIYDEGTDVDTGVATMTDTPSSSVIEIDEAFSPDEKKQPGKKGSWLWKTGATVMGAGLVGLAGIGIYKYLNH